MLPLILEPRILTSLQQGLEFDSRLSAAGLQYMSDPIKVRSGCVKAFVLHTGSNVFAKKRNIAWTRGLPKYLSL